MRFPPFRIPYKTGQKSLVMDPNTEYAPQLVVIAGSLDSEGETVASDHDRELVYKKTFLISQSTTDFVHVCTLTSELGIADADLHKYQFEVVVRYDPYSDMDATDDVKVRVGDGGATAQDLQIDSVGQGHPLGPLMGGVLFPGWHTHTKLYVDCVDWAAAETHTYLVTLEAYKLRDEAAKPE